MRTAIDAVLAGRPVRGVVTVSALVEIAAHRDDFPAVMQRCARGNVGDISAVLKACLRAAGVKPAELAPEVDRLIEDAGLEACGKFCVELLSDAFDKASRAADFPDAGDRAAATPSAPENLSGSPA